MPPGVVVRVEGIDTFVRTARSLHRVEGDRKLLRTIGMLAVRGMRRHFDEGRGPDGKVWPRVRRGGQPLIDTRGLYNSITFQILPDGKGVRVGSNKRYGITHHRGLRITAKPGKMLAIPLTPEAARMRRPLRTNTALAKAFVFRSKRGNVLLAKRKEDGTLTLLFLLRKSVKIKQRRWAGVSRRTSTEIGRATEARLTEIWKGRR